jgi:hypothetical protein
MLVASSPGHPAIRRDDGDLATFKDEYAQCLRGVRLSRNEGEIFFGRTTIENPQTSLSDADGLTWHPLP